MVSPSYTVVTGRSQLVLAVTPWETKKEGKKTTSYSVTATDIYDAAIGMSLDHLGIGYTYADNSYAIKGNDAEKLKRVIQASRFQLKTPKAIIRLAGPWEDFLTKGWPREQNTLIPIGSLSQEAMQVVVDSLRQIGIKNFEIERHHELGTVLAIHGKKDVAKLHEIEGTHYFIPPAPIAANDYRALHDMLIIGSQQHWRGMGIDETISLSESDAGKLSFKAAEIALEHLGIKYSYREIPSAQTGSAAPSLWSESVHPQKGIVIDPEFRAKFKSALDSARKSMTKPMQVVQGGGFLMVDVDNGSKSLVFVQQPIEFINLVLQALEVFGIENSRSRKISSTAPYSIHMVTGDISNLKEIYDSVPIEAIEALQNEARARQSRQR